MIKSISLEKFKAFSSLDQLEIKPLTILCGVNSGGKSSILKSLLLLKQSYENTSAVNEATLNGLYTTNGLMEDVLYNGKGDNFSIRNVFQVKYQGKKFVTTSKQDITTAKELGKITGLSSQIASWFTIDVTCSIKKANSISTLWDRNYIDRYSVIITPLSRDGKTIPEKKFEIELTYKAKGKGKYDIKLINFPTVSGNNCNYLLESCTCYFSGMRLTNLYYEKVNQAQDILLNDFLTNIYAVFRIVAEQYNGLKYLGPLRENPKRQYTITNEFFSADSTGADTPFILARNQSKNVIAELSPPADESNFDKKIQPLKHDLHEVVQSWMSYFELGELNLVSQQDSLQLRIKNNNIADVGFGISQTLPVIVHGLSMNYEQTLILEQPEIHLHPRMQMRMSDLLLTLSQTNHGVIVETHSDHIINRIVRRALEAEDESVLNNIAIYFVSNSENGSKVVPITIDRVCGISECPQEFFTQFASETSFIINAGLNNMNRGNS